MIEEFDTPQKLVCLDIECCDKIQIPKVKGLESTSFECGYAIIDSSRYAKDLLRCVIRKCNGYAQFRPNTTVKEILERMGGVQV
jgi:hypothetical protein